MSANCQTAKIHGSPSPNEDAAAEARPCRSEWHAGSSKTSARLRRAQWSRSVEPFHLGMATAVFALSILFLLGACAATDNGKRDDPAVFGSASGANGGAGATTGLSFGW
jgi:hypothetical protein